MASNGVKHEYMFEEQHVDGPPGPAFFEAENEQHQLMVEEDGERSPVAYSNGGNVSVSPAANKQHSGFGHQDNNPNSVIPAYAGLMSIINSQQNQHKQQLLALRSNNNNQAHASHRIGESVLGKRYSEDSVDELHQVSQEVIEHPPVAAERIKGKRYLVKGKVKRWDGKRFARCCEGPGCNKLAQGVTAFCKNHGGGARCEQQGCTKAARGGSTRCALHGGGRRCTIEGCSKAAIGPAFCRKHGGGKACQHPGCKTSARGRTDFCVSHGGGTRCSAQGCTKSARVSKKGATYCRKHSKALALLDPSQNGANQPKLQNHQGPLIPPPPPPPPSSLILNGFVPPGQNTQQQNLHYLALLQ